MRSACLALSVLFVLAVILIVLLVVLPEVATTFTSIGRNLETLLPRLQEWLIKIFPDSKQMVAWIQNLEFNWDQIIQYIANFLKNGASNILNSTFSAARTVINTVMNFCVGFVFACYILLQKENCRFR